MFSELSDLEESTLKWIVLAEPVELADIMSASNSKILGIDGSGQF